MPRPNMRSLSAFLHNLGSDDALGAQISDDVQLVYVADDLSYLLAPKNYAQGMAGTMARTGLATLSNVAWEIFCPTTLEGLWLHKASLGIALTGTLNRVQVKRGTASVLTADQTLLTNNAVGSLAPVAEVTFGSVLTAGIDLSDGPIFAATGINPQLSLPSLWVPGGEFVSFVSESAGTVLATAMCAWLEVPRMLP